LRTSYSILSNRKSYCNSTYPSLQATADANFLTTRLIGNKRYELTNHLGNVRNIISDARLSTATGTAPNITFIAFATDDRALYNMFAYGMPKTSPNDYIENPTDKYRFGFNTQEKVDEISGAGNHNTALFWEYDTRLGRRWNVDPVDQMGMSNYAVMRGNPILLIDILGDDPSSFTYVCRAKGVAKYKRVNGQRLTYSNGYHGGNNDGEEKRKNGNSADDVNKKFHQNENGYSSNNDNVRHSRYCNTYTKLDPIIVSASSYLNSNQQANYVAAVDGGYMPLIIEYDNTEVYAILQVKRNIDLKPTTPKLLTSTIPFGGQLVWNSSDPYLISKESIWPERTYLNMSALIFDVRTSPLQGLTRGENTQGVRALITVGSVKIVKAQIDLGANIHGQGFIGGRGVVETPKELFKDKPFKINVPYSIEGSLGFRIHWHLR
jgi:hypothetical protein